MLRLGKELFWSDLTFFAQNFDFMKISVSFEVLSNYYQGG
jgi:hypothetical protein